MKKRILCLSLLLAAIPAFAGESALKEGTFIKNTGDIQTDCMYNAASMGYGVNRGGFRRFSRPYRMFRQGFMTGFTPPVYNYYNMPYRGYTGGYYGTYRPYGYSGYYSNAYYNNPYIYNESLVTKVKRFFNKDDDNEYYFKNDTNAKNPYVTGTYNPNTNKKTIDLFSSGQGASMGSYQDGMGLEHSSTSGGGASVTIID